jgi:cytochrome P450
MDIPISVTRLVPDIAPRLNANTIPITCWALIEIIKNKSLFQAIRAEASIAWDSSSTGRKLNVKKLRELPLLQSVYTETLRMHVAINIVRNIEQDMILDGYALKKGYLVSTPARLSHFDDRIWSDADHPASEFWAERHITHVEKLDASGNKTTVPQFSIAGRSGGFFPFGKLTFEPPHFRILTAM